MQHEVDPLLEPEVFIEKAFPEDAPAIWRVTRKAYEPYRGRIFPTFQALRVRVSTIRWEIQTGARIYGVARCNGRVVATLRCRRRRGYLALSRLAVLPEYQHAGIGRRMMAWAEEVARELGYRELRGDVRRVMPGLLAYYQSQGYRRVRRQRRRSRLGYLITVRKRL